eukprot:m.72753 g.72753  ORF g.72753 m.72753 type:complete len:155 (+) comp12356_c0_seq1:109-573(+)
MAFLGAALMRLDDDFDGGLDGGLVSRGRPPRGPPPQVPGWQEARTQDGRVYWFNRATGESSWVRPIQSGPPLPPGWTMHRTEQGQVYFFNTKTKASTYTHPGIQAQQQQTTQKKEKNYTARWREPLGSWFGLRRENVFITIQNQKSLSGSFLQT